MSAPVQSACPVCIFGDAADEADLHVDGLCRCACHTSATRPQLAALEAAEADYLRASGWVEYDGLWRDPETGLAKSHIARVAAYKQRQRDAAEDNRAAAGKGGGK